MAVIRIKRPGAPRGAPKSANERLLPKDPFAVFALWFKDAKAAGEPWPESMTLATAGRDLRPSARIVLLKDLSKGGFVFFTNYESRKGQELAENPEVALLFHWPRLERQVRVEGRIAKVPRAESVRYFRTRPRDSQIGAWASPQSTAIARRDVLEARFAEFEEKFRGKPIPCPPHWGGYRVLPERVEFWQGRAHRLHDRWVYVREGREWRIQRLAP